MIVEREREREREMSLWSVVLMVIAVVSFSSPIASLTSQRSCPCASPRLCDRHLRPSSSSNRTPSSSSSAETISFAVTATPLVSDAALAKTTRLIGFSNNSTELDTLMCAAHNAGSAFDIKAHVTDLHTLVHNDNALHQLVNAIANAVDESFADGVNFDYEGVIGTSPTHR